MISLRLTAAALTCAALALANPVVQTSAAVITLNLNNWANPGQTNCIQRDTGPAGASSACSLTNLTPLAGSGQGDAWAVADYGYLHAYAYLSTSGGAVGLGTTGQADATASFADVFSPTTAAGAGFNGSLSVLSALQGAVSMAGGTGGTFQVTVRDLDSYSVATCTVTVDLANPHAQTCTSNLSFSAGDRISIFGDLSAGVFHSLTGGAFAGTADFADTGYIDGIQFADAAGNALPGVSLNSESGALYDGAAEAPEPSFGLILGGAAAILLAYHRRKSTRRPARAHF